MICILGEVPDFSDCVHINKYTYVISSSLNESDRVDQAASQVAAVLPGLQWAVRLWVSVRGQSQHQSGNPICRAGASGISAMCLS